MWPLLSDSTGKVLSFPPIINSNDLGRITEDSRNVLIEVTGTFYETVLNTLNMMATSLADRGGRIFTTKVHYPHKELGKTVTPQLRTKTMRISLYILSKGSINMLGTEFHGAPEWKNHSSSPYMTSGQYPGFDQMVIHQSSSSQE